MRTIRIILAILLVLVSAAFFATHFIQAVSGKDQGPQISCPEQTISLSVTADKSAFLAGITASDPQDGDLTDKIVLGGISNLITSDTAKATYYVFDCDNNMASCVRYIHYTDYHKPTFSLNSALIFENDSVVTLTEQVNAQDVIDGDLSDSIRISTLTPTRDNEVFGVTVQVTNSMGDLARVELPVIIQEQRSSRPVIRLREHLLYLSQGAEFDPQDYLASASVVGKSLSYQDLEILNQVDTSQPGNYWVWYTYTNNDFVGTAILTVVVE